MKRVFSLSGILSGLAAALLVGLFASHTVGWFLAGLVVGMTMVALPAVVSGIRRSRSQEHEINRDLNSMQAKG